MSDSVESVCLGWPEPYIYRYLRCIYGIFSREITIHTAMYGADIRFWPTLCMSCLVQWEHTARKRDCDAHTHTYTQMVSRKLGMLSERATYRGRMQDLHTNMQVVNNRLDMLSSRAAHKQAYNNLFSPFTHTHAHTRTHTSHTSHTQVVSNELAMLSQQRDSQADELQRLSGRLGSAEQLVRAKEAEVEDLRRAYEGLALDNRR